MSDTPRTDAAAMPIDRIDTTASRPCNVVHEDVCRQLERELAEAREQISTLMHQQTIAMQELQEKWHAALKQRDILETALMIIEGYYVDGENTYEDWKAMGQTAKNALSRITLI